MKAPIYRCLLAAVLLTSLCFAFKPKPKVLPYKFKFQDRSLNIEARVNDLVARMTLEEKVAQMLNAAPAIPRLGVPAYNWWSESLHGVARTPFKVTVYPQAIGMAATFDVNSLHQMGDYTADEGRAIYNISTKNNNRDIYLGLTYWTPNINIFRDPRWGRGQETYGEDPFLTASMGKAFVTGLQGNDPVYLKAAACAKHYAVHSGPEPTRHNFDVNPSDYDLWDTYLPAFRNLVVNAKVAGVMCAYNAFRGQPCCGSDILLTNILRDKWKFTGYMTSDCGAIDDFYQRHKTHTSAETASADAVLHGTDVECGNVSYLSLQKAVHDKMITEQQIDVSVKRLFTIRFRLGMFDPPGSHPYDKIGASALEAPAHKALALKMAQQSIILLKNENHLLPLSKNLKHIAVIGPNADNPESVLGNYNGIPSEISTPYQAIKAKLGSRADVYYDQAIDYVKDSYTRYINFGQDASYEGKKGFKAEYFTTTDLSGTPAITRTENVINDFWRTDFTSEQIAQTHFAGRWTTDYTSPADEDVVFELGGDETLRLAIDGEQKILIRPNQSYGQRTYTLHAVKGKTYRIVTQYYHTDDHPEFSFKAGVVVKNDPEAVAKRVSSADAVIFVGGISPQLEGEEMPVTYEGFKGGDRTSIMLPKVQTELLKALQQTGKPVIFVLMTGSAIAVPWEAEHLPVIVNAWYGGQAAGTALADVLFGDYNPAGRLPVTFYAGDSDLPGFDDYSMHNRTYRYFTGKPLYGFGYGLSYTQFTYSPLHLPSVITKGKLLTMHVQVKNTGKYDGEEVAELYITHKGLQTPAPIRALKGFKRIFIKAGATQDVVFTLKPEDLSVVLSDGQLKEVPGSLTISVGGSQPDASTAAMRKTVSGAVRIL